MTAHPLAHTLLPTDVATHVQAWLKEDIPAFDPGALFVGAAPARATLWGKTSGTLAGVPWVDALFAQLDCHVQWHVPEGTAFDVPPAGRVAIATVTGPTHRILQGERTALNLLARCSGIATRTQSVVRRVRDLGFRGKIAATRKTTPGFRAPEKYAVAVAGGDPHRMDLSSMVMLKDNHVAAAGVDWAVGVARVKTAVGFATKLEVEAGSLATALAAARAGADIVMLDNFTPESLPAVARQVKEAAPHVLLEVSGGIQVSDVHRYLDPHVDIISLGALTQGVPHVDFSLKIDPKLEG